MILFELPTLGKYTSLDGTVLASPKEMFSLDVILKKNQTRSYSNNFLKHGLLETAIISKRGAYFNINNFNKKIIIVTD